MKNIIFLLVLLLCSGNSLAVKHSEKCIDLNVRFWKVDTKFLKADREGRPFGLFVYGSLAAGLMERILDEGCSDIPVEMLAALGLTDAVAIKKNWEKEENLYKQQKTGE